MDEPSVVAVVSEAVSLQASMRAVDVALLTGSACALVAEEWLASSPASMVSHPSGNVEAEPVAGLGHGRSTCNAFATGEP